MLTKPRKTIISTVLSIIITTFTVGMIVFAAPWADPTAMPPGNNAPEPINVSSGGQAKSGGLILNTGGAAVGLLIQNGNVGIGMMNPSYKLDISGGMRVSGTSIAGDFCTSSGKCLSQMTASVPVPTSCSATAVFWSSHCCGNLPTTSVGGVATAISGGNSCSSQPYNTFDNGSATYSCTTSGWQRTSCSCNGNPC